MVGCVVVKDDRVVGEAWHRRAGSAHAEVLALERAGERARGATLYVNLEPCAHQGRTPPCAPRLAAAGLRRVVAAVRDPNPAVAGRGLALLRRSRVAVTTGVMESDALLLNEPFFDLAGLRMTAAGQPIGWQRDSLDNYSFQLEVPAGADSVEVTLDFLLPSDPNGFTQAASSSANLVVVKIGANGKVDLSNLAGSTDVVIDVVGWYG